jgi:hypothetical protein
MKFSDPKEMLNAIAADDTVVRFAICVVRKDGSTDMAYFEMTQAELAFASVVCADQALETNPWGARQKNEYRQGRSSEGVEA